MRIGLIGNQNSGKSTIFNYLTNSRQQVGNWAGVTVDKKEVSINDNIIVDLPGVYSLNGYTIEENITINYINKLDVIVNVLDVTNLSRGLYLTLQLIDLNIPMVIVLTKQDKVNINVSRLSLLLDISVVDKSINEIVNKARNSSLNFKCENEDQAISKRYDYIDSILSSVLDECKENNCVDKIILNKYLSIPLFIFVMFIVYYISFNTISVYLNDIINNWFLFIESKISTLSIPPFYISLINDGILNSLGVVVSFIPSISLLYLCLTFLETTGYMSRISFIMDKMFRLIGLNGKSIISFIMGTSCSVPGILVSRTIENTDQRYITALLTSLIPCSAKMTIIMMFAKILFPVNTGIYIFFIYIISVFFIFLMAFILRKWIFYNTTNYYINEITDYEIPNIKKVLKITYNKITSFLKRVSKTLIISSIVIWFLYNISFDFSFVNMDGSILGVVSRKIAFLFYPFLGKNSYECAIAIVEGFVAKERVTSSLLISSKLNDMSVAELFNNSVAMYAFLIFNLFCFPCISSIVTLKKEIGLRLVLLFLVFQTFFAYVVAIIIYHIGILL